MRSGESYDYFYEVDGERVYDFNCDTDDVEVREVSHTITKMSVGQIIIANSIQIEEKDDDAVTSFTDSFNNSANESNNSENWQGEGPIVSWPVKLAQLVMQMKPTKDTMVL